ncbi:uncharacterized protein ARMOST_02644 [Armillaria ostoyae]|uniref:Uncharacterized protein n=1 Tax=Armillaria ostoyae TaxID=47428 RepID=A0A284QSI9_ARMOS|nr:uncharacterized protein ARMOST_02644 [Armillaria ostoyae]
MQRRSVEFRIQGQYECQIITNSCGGGMAARMSIKRSGITQGFKSRRVVVRRSRSTHFHQNLGAAYEGDVMSSVAASS